MAPDDEDFMDGPDTLAQRIDSIAGLIATTADIRDRPGSAQLRKEAIETIRVARQSLTPKPKKAAPVTFLGRPAEYGPFHHDDEGNGG